MARYRHRLNFGENNQLVFLTTSVLSFALVFARDEMRNLMAASLLNDIAYYRAGLHAFVVMPHHIHLLARMPMGKDSSWLMNRLKSNSPKRLLPRLTLEERTQFADQAGLNDRALWQVSFRAFTIDSEYGFMQKVEYIHNNPVRKGLCEKATNWFCCSAWMFDEGLWNEEDGLRITPGLVQRFAGPSGLLLDQIGPWEAPEYDLK